MVGSFDCNHTFRTIDWRDGLINARSLLNKSMMPTSASTARSAEIRDSVIV
jgi:hypothetical protein